MAQSLNFSPVTHSFEAHVKLLFFGGGELKPLLPQGKKHNGVDFHSDEELLREEKQVKAWLRPAKMLPGWNLKKFTGKVS